MSDVCTVLAGSQAFSDKLVEELSCFLNRAYSNKGRHFHGIGHAHCVSEIPSGSPTATLAGLFHDVIYLQLDRDNAEEIKTLVEPFVLQPNYSLILPESSKDPWVRVLMKIFGFKSQQEVKIGTGLNEFLSAWAAIQKLKFHLKASDLLQIVVNIYATMPYWGFKGSSESFSEVLSGRVRLSLIELSLDAPQKFIDRIITECVEVGNQDVMNFAEKDLRLFLSNTWSLLTEINPNLGKRYFTTFTYRNALVGMDAFMSSLDYKFIFRSHCGSPSLNELTKLEQLAKKNISLGSYYIKFRVLEACLVSSFAELSDGDGPLEMFVGPKPDRREGNVLSIDQFFETNFKSAPLDHNPTYREVWDLLAGESPFRSSFDGKSSVIASFLFKNLNQEEFQNAFSMALKYAKGACLPRQYLETLPPDIVRPLLKAAIEISFTRRDALSRLLETI